MKRLESCLFVYPLLFSYQDLSHGIILALQNLPLPYPQMLRCPFNATSSPTDNQISWSLFKESVFLFRGWVESHKTGFGGSNTLETCLGPRIGARVQGDMSLGYRPTDNSHWLPSFVWQSDGSMHSRACP